MLIPKSIVFRLIIVFFVNSNVIFGTLTCFSQTSQTGIVKGKIFDGSTFRILPGVIVKDEKSGNEVISYPDGFYQIPLDTGIISLSFYRIGFQKKVIKQITVKRDGVVFLDVIIRPLVQDISVKQRNKQPLDSILVKDSLINVNYSDERIGRVYNPLNISSEFSDILEGIECNSLINKNAFLLSRRLNGVMGFEVPGNFHLQTFMVSGLGQRYNQLQMDGSLMPSDAGSRAFPISFFPSELMNMSAVRNMSDATVPADFSGGNIVFGTRELPERSGFFVQFGAGFSDNSGSSDFKTGSLSAKERLSIPVSYRNPPSSFPTTRSQYSLKEKNPQERVDLLRELPNRLQDYKSRNIRPSTRVLLGWEKSIRLKSGATLGLIAYLNQETSENSYENNVQVSPDVEGNPFPFNEINTPVIRSFARSTDYQFASQSGLFVNGTLFLKKSKVSLKTIIGNQFSDRYSERYRICKPDEDTLANRSIREMVEQRKFVHVQISGDHALGTAGRFRMDWTASYWKTSQRNPDEINLLLRENNTSSDYFELAQPITVPLPDRNAVSRYVLDANLDAIFTNSNRSWKNQDDHFFTGGFNLSSSFNLFGRSQVLKGGVYLQTTYRKFYSDLLLYQGEGIYKLNSILAPERYYPGGQTVEEYYEKLIGQSGRFSSVDVKADNYGNYTGSSNIGSSYVQMENHILSNLSAKWGFRIESSSQLVSTTEYTYIEGFKNAQIVPLDENLSVTKFNILPSVSVRYNFLPALAFQFSFFKTVNRPSIQELSSYRYYDASIFMVKSGNRALVNNNINNFQAEFNWSPRANTLITVSGFYKYMSQPIENMITGFANAKGNMLSVPYNMPEATVTGLQASFKIPVSNIQTSSLSSLFLTGKAGLFHSQVEAGPIKNNSIPYLSEHTLSGTPDYALNGGLVFQRAKLPALSVLYSRTGDYILFVGSGSEKVLENGNSILNASHYRVQGSQQLDLQLSYVFFKSRLQLIGGINNLLASDYTIYQDLNGNEQMDSPLKIVESGIGVGRYAGGVDNTVLSIRGQRNYYLRISFLFK